MNRTPAEELAALGPPPAPPGASGSALESPPRLAGFRLRLRAAIMLVVGVVTAAALYFAQHGLAARVEADLQREFQSELAARHNAQQLRYGGLFERCRALVRKPRIQSALEDDALDLLYLNAEDELRDIMAGDRVPNPDQTLQGLQAVFYRFLDRQGAVIPPPKPLAVGMLSAAEEAQLALPKVPPQPQVGYLGRMESAGRTAISEVIAMPIFSGETGEVIAGLALGFKPFEFRGPSPGSGMRSGIWLNGAMDGPEFAGLAETVMTSGAADAPAEPVRVVIEGAPHLLFSKRLNPGSLYPPAYEACVYPLAQLEVRQRQLRWQVLGTGSVLLLLGLAASHVVSSRLSAPVEKLAVDSELDRAERKRAEAALEMTSAELQRSARFSADASHQLKTPVTVLRAGLDELLARENLTASECHEISALIHQTYRLSSLIEDLLLLSRMDAGRLKLEFSAVDLTQLIEASLDDLSALPDEHGVKVETSVVSGLHIAGEKRYTTIILQNLLENARKYNQPGGRIRIEARPEGGMVLLTIGNTGRPISAAAQSHIFERFHRGAMGENVPGYGLGLNLARELARLHGGDLRLARSDENGTEFEVRFRMAPS